MRKNTFTIYYITKFYAFQDVTINFSCNNKRKYGKISIFFWVFCGQTSIL